MEYKHIKINKDRFIIKFNSVVFRDISEFVVDMRNIFAQFLQVYGKIAKLYEIIPNKEEAREKSSVLFIQLKELQNQLIERLNYITDSNQIDESMVGPQRPKLMQLKRLAEVNLDTNLKENMENLIDYYFNRVLEQKIAVTKIFSNKKE